MHRCVLVIGSLAAVIGAFQLESCSAQGFVPRSTNVNRATRDYIINRPTVSPYLNLTRRTSQFSPPNYQTLVRPALERRAREAQQAVAMRHLQTQVQSLEGQIDPSQRQRGGQFTSGHPTRFFTYLHYYPSLGRRR